MAVNDRAPAAAGRVLHVEAFRRHVSDLDRSIEFYCDALGFELDMVRIGSDSTTLADGGRLRPRKRAVLVLGNDMLELVVVEPGTDTIALREAAGRACSLAFQHFAIVAADMDAAFLRLARFAPAMISAGPPVRLPPAAGSVTAVKFRDPDGHPLELIAFPPGAGDARWQRHAGDAATLGIDHSAIVVADAARSIAFYREVLGCSVATRQVNHGAEQDSLDGLAAVEVDVVALCPAASTTPHLELLGYRQPRPAAGAAGRRSSASCGDCIVWNAANLGAIAATLRRLGMPMVARAEQGGDPDELLLHDPDGHSHLLLSER